MCHFFRGQFGCFGLAGFQLGTCRFLCWSHREGQPGLPSKWTKMAHPNGTDQDICFLEESKHIDLYWSILICIDLYCHIWMLQYCWRWGKALLFPSWFWNPEIWNPVLENVPPGASPKISPACWASSMTSFGKRTSSKISSCTVCRCFSRLGAMALFWKLECGWFLTFWKKSFVKFRIIPTRNMFKNVWNFLKPWVQSCFFSYLLWQSLVGGQKIQSSRHIDAKSKLPKCLVLGDALVEGCEVETAWDWCEEVWTKKGAKDKSSPKMLSKRNCL